MNSRTQFSLAAALFLTALTTLMVEVLLIRVTEVILMQNIGYSIITCAMFGFGLAGACAVVWPVREGQSVNRRLAILSIAFAVSVFVLRYALNTVPILFDVIPSRPVRFMAAGAIIYFALLTPFVLSGLILSYLFSAFPEKVRTLYFWDLTGAAIGCVIFLPFLERIGPGGLMFLATAAALLCSVLFSGKMKYFFAAAPAIVLLSALPFLSDTYYEFAQLYQKRGVLSAQAEGRIELARWDPISKIDVISLTPTTKHVAYDGGSQSSHLFRFDGNYEALRDSLTSGTAKFGSHFWNRGVAASHFLRRDTGAEVLVIGSAAGQETKAALLFGAAHVDGVELVGAVVELGKGRYSDFIGGIFRDPRVNVHVGEGRSFIRTTPREYDIIQIFSNHTSSSVASGSGATVPIYLQTVEAYTEYFQRLKDDGILHINHHFYPRMVTVAAKAWKDLGRSDFERHVLVFSLPGWDSLPTMLVKMSPWTPSEVESVRSFLGSGDNPSQMVVNPLNLGSGFLSPDFFTGDVTPLIQADLDYDIRPSTDDWPYFSNIQRKLDRVEVDPSRFLDQSMADAVNGRLATPLGEYLIFGGIAVIGLVFGLILILVPLWRSDAARAEWHRRPTTIAYFALLGTGFIVIELVLIQMFMRLIGFPLYTYSAVIFTMLLAAGLGSMAAHKWNIDPRNRWLIPFVGVLATGLILIETYQPITDLLLSAQLPIRLTAAIALIFPVGFFLGMPFPLGILALKEQPPGVVAWAWGTNGYFTVVGGVLCGFMSLFVGFRMTFFFGLLVYVVALVTFMKLRASVPAVAHD